MTTQTLPTIAVFFGGPSPEHEVSIITGLQLLKHIDTTKYSPLPVYVDKVGKWWTGTQATQTEYFATADLTQPKGLDSFQFDISNPPKIEVALLCFHGRYGEGGYVQGILEAAGIPHQGPLLTPAAVCFDKIFTRQVLQASGFQQAKYAWFTLADWQERQAELITKIQKAFDYPVFVKPANGGSTIGISRAKNQTELAAALKLALTFDDRVIVEEEITDCIEVNVSVLGDLITAKASVPEQPIKQDEFLSFADKYERGGGKKSGMASASRRIPAPISSRLTTHLQESAVSLFKLFGCSGVVRIDFFVNPSTEMVFVTEINTIPGSMSFYLWQASGLEYPALITELIAIAKRVHAQKQALTTTFSNNILQKQ